MDLDKFGDIIDNFLTEADAQMLIHMPPGTQEVTVEDNIGAGSVVQFYFLLQALGTISDAMCEDMKLTKTCEAWKDIVNTLLEMVRAELAEEAK